MENDDYKKKIISDRVTSPKIINYQPTWRHKGGEFLFQSSNRTTVSSNEEEEKTFTIIFDMSLLNKCQRICSKFLDSGLWITFSIYFSPKLLNNIMWNRARWWDSRLCLILQLHCNVSALLTSVGLQQTYTCAESDGVRVP